MQGGRVYLRKYQASSATMSSSRDRTSTVGRMWWLGDVTSSEEEGEAEPGVREHRQQRSRKRGARPMTSICCKCLAAFMCLSHVNIASVDKAKSKHDTATQLLCSLLATGLI